MSEIVLLAICCVCVSVQTQHKKFGNKKSQKNTNNMVLGLSIEAVIIAVVIIAGACHIAACVGQA